MKKGDFPHSAYHERGKIASMSELMMKAPEKTLTQLGEEVRALTQQAKAMNLYYAIEVGRRLAEAKEQVAHGEWGRWLADETEFSQSKANRLMRVFNEYGSDQIGIFGMVEKSSALTNLSLTNALALLAIPEDQREEFALEVDAEHLSSRDLERVIRERDEARKALQTTEARFKDAQRTFADLGNQNSELLRKLAQAREDLKAADDEAERNEQRLKARIQELESRPIDVAVQVDEDAAHRAAEEAREAADKEWREKLKKAEKKLAEAEKKAQKAEEAAKNAETAAGEKASEALETAKQAERAAKAEAIRLREETERLRRELAMADTATTTFKWHFAAWQNAYHGMKEALGSAGEEVGGKLRAAIEAQLAAWKEDGAA